MRISVIIACLNASATLDRCLDSIDGQRYADVEAVVADGGSKDRTIGIVREFASRFGDRLTWFSEPDDGIADAWNKGVARATGEWLLFLGADDMLASPEVLSAAAETLSRAAPRYRVVYGRVAMVDKAGRHVDYMDRPWSPSDFRGCRLNLPHQAVFHHRSLFREHGVFDTSLIVVSDFDFLLRELMHAEPLHLPGLTVANMQIGGLSTNRCFAPKVVLEEIKLLRRHVGGVPYVLTWWLIKTWGIALLFRLGGDRLALRVTNSYRRLIGGRAPLHY